MIFEIFSVPILQNRHDLELFLIQVFSRLLWGFEFDDLRFWSNGVKIHHEAFLILKIYKKNSLFSVKILSKYSHWKIKSFAIIVFLEDESIKIFASMYHPQGEENDGKWIVKSRGSEVSPFATLFFKRFKFSQLLRWCKTFDDAYTGIPPLTRFFWSEKNRNPKMGLFHYQSPLFCSFMLMWSAPKYLLKLLIKMLFKCLNQTLFGDIKIIAFCVQI